MEDILWPPPDDDGRGPGYAPEFSWDAASHHQESGTGAGDGITLSLVDARTDEIIRPLTYGDVIDPAELSGGSFSIVALVDDDLDAESVVFKLNGKTVQIESIEPYSLFGDSEYDGNIFGHKLFKEGEYELEASAYSRNHGRGQELAEVTLRFTIGPDSSNTAPQAADDQFGLDEHGKTKVPKPGVLDNDTDSDGDRLKVAEVNGAAHKVGHTIKLDSGALLKLNRDGSFTYDPNGKFDYLDDGEIAFDSFDYTVSDGRGGRSTATSTLTIHGVTEPSDIRLFLVDADEDIVLRELKDGDTIDPAEFAGKTFSIVAEVDRHLHADSVVFELNGDKVRTENIVPYALFGDNLRGDYAGRSLFEPGSYQLEASAYSRNHGRGKELAEETISFTIGAPALSVAVTAIEEDTGADPADGVTSDDTLVINGTATPDSEVEVFIDGGPIGTTMADGGGAWSLDHSGTALGEGDFEITAEASDGAGTASSDPFEVTVDRTPPAVPLFDLAPGSDGGALGDKLTNVSPVTLVGTTDPNMAVTFEPLGLETTSDGTGAFSFADVPLVEGSNGFTVVATDAAGNSSSSTMMVKLDTAAPQVSVVGIEEDNGKEPDDGITNDDTLVIEGNATPGSEVEVFIDGGLLGTAGVDAGGAWSFDHSGTALGEGQFEITAVASDAAGNATISDAFAVTIDQTAPQVAVTAVDEDTGTPGDGLTSDDTLVISGTASPDSIIEVFIDGVSIGMTMEAAGTWGLNHTGVALGEGDFEITAQAMDLAGNLTASAVFDLIIDQTPPAEPLFDLAAASDGGAQGDKVTDVTPVGFEGTTDPNTAVRLEPLGLETVSDGSGAFGFADIDLVLGDNEFTVVATDAAGNSSASTMTFVLQAAAPVVAVTAIEEDTGASGADGVTMDDTLVISGTATPSSPIEVFIDGGSIGNTSSDGDGNWSLDHTGTALGEGSFVVTAEVGGGGGTSTSNDFPVTIDQTAPAVAVTGIEQDTGTPGDGVTNDDTLVFNGTAEPGASVEVFLDGASFGTTAADGGGAWSLDLGDTTLGEGSFDVTAKATDLAGNVTESAVFALTIDLTGPAAPTLALPAAFDGGVAGDLITNVNPVTLAGTSDPDTPIAIAELGLATTTDGAGNFEFTGVVLSEGANELTVTATDPLGNESVEVFTVVLDAVAPVFTLGAPDEAVPLDETSRLQGTADGTGSALASLTYDYDVGTSMPVPFDPATGAFDVALDLSTLSLGDHVLDVVGFDVAGNLGVSVLFVSLDAFPPLTISKTTPATLSDEVGISFHPQINFSRPVDPGSLTDGSFYATDPAGNKIPANIVKKLDGSGAYLFFEESLPGASRITVHVDGDLIEGAADGALLDGDGDGLPGGEFTYSFTTVNQEAVPGTTLVGRVLDPGPDLLPRTADDVDPGLDGELGTEDDVYLLPIEGVKVWILGHENEAVFTDADGFFELTSVPSGDVKVAVDGQTATDPPGGKYFPEIVMDIVVRPGVENTIPGGAGTPEQQGERQGIEEIYLPRLDESLFVPVSDTDPTLVGVDEVTAPELTAEQRANLNLLVQPGSILGHDGQPLSDAVIGISTVPAVIVRDMLPQGLLQHTFDITIQAPEAAVFGLPVQATFPNVFDAAPGTQLNFLSFDHTTGRLVIEGTATVSADGLSVVTDPDTGIVKPGWHGLTPAGSASMGPDEPPDPKHNNLNQDDYNAIAKKAQDAILKVLAQFTQIGAIVDAYKSGAENAAKLVDETGNTLDSLNDNDQGGLFRGAANTAIAVKDLTKAGFDVVKTAGEALTVSKAKGILEIARQTIKVALEGAERYEARNPPECPNPSLESYINTLKSLDFLGDQIKNGLDFLDGAVNGVKNQLLFGGACFILLSLKAFIDKTFPPPPGGAAVPALALAEGPGIAALAEDPADRPIQDLMTPEELAEFQTGLADALGVFQDLDAAFQAIDILQIEQQIEEVGDAYDDAAVASGQLYVSAYGNPGNAYFRITGAQGFELRGQTGANGQLDVFLPDSTELTLQIYDARTNSIGETTFTTAPSGQTTQIPIPFYYNIDNPADFPDSDGDLLADLAETIVGTDANLADSDGDGPSDFVEVKNGLNPLDGVPVATGILASLPLSGEAMELVIQGASETSEGDIAFIATGGFGLATVDVTNPFVPLVLAELDLPGTSSDVALDSALGIAVLAGGAGGLHFVEVSGPESPMLLSTAGIAPSQVEIFNGLAFANDGAGLASFDVATGQALQTLTFGLGSVDVVGLAREGRFLYATDETGMLRVVEIVGDQMVERGAVQVPNGGTRPFVGDGLVFLPVDTTGGFATVDVSDPDNPAVVSLADSDSIANRDIALNGSGLGIMVGSLTVNADETSLDVVDTSDPADTSGFLTRFVLPAAARGVAIGTGIAFVADGTAGLQVVNYRALDDQGLAPDLTVTLLPEDADAVEAGIQVFEGQRVSLEATVADDVQVRNVELLVNGAVARNDVSYPFELFADMPTIAENGDSDAVTLQIRVSDTGGNTTLSEEIAIQLVPDVTPPLLVAQNIAQDQEVGSSFRSFTFSFSEPLDPGSVSAQSFKLLDPLGVEVEPTSVQLSFDRTTVKLSYAPLAQGAHSFSLDAAMILDLAGNPLGAGISTTDFTVSDFTVTFTGGGDGVSWFDPDNWSTGVVPDATDDVFIPAEGPGSVTFLGGVDEVVVSRLVLDETLDIQAGMLRVTNEAELSGVKLTAGQLALDGTSSIVDLEIDFGTLDGAGTASVTGSLDWDGNGQMTGTGTTLVAEGATASLGLTGFDLDLGRTLEIAGTAQLFGSVAFGTFDAGTATSETGILSVLASGSLEFVDEAGTFLNLGAPPHQILNAGTILKTGPGTASLFSVPLTDTGSITVQEGVLEIAGGGTSSGAFTVDAGAGLLFSFNDFTLESGTTLTGAGDVSASNALVTVESDQALGTTGLVKADDNGGFDFTLDISLANLEIDSTSTLRGVTGEGDLTVTGTLDWVSGVMGGTGKTTLAAAATASLGDSVTPAQEILTLVRELEIAGSATLDSALLVFGSVSDGFITLPATLTILDGGSFEALGEADMGSGNLGVALTIANSGGFTKSGAGETTVNAQIGFTNNATGTITVDVGILRILGLFVDNGTTSETNGGQLLFV